MRNLFPVDGQHLVAVLDNIARQSYDPLDVVHIGIDGIAEHHDTAATGLTQFNDFLVDDRQANAILKFVDQNEVAILQSGQHRARRNAKRLDDKRTTDEHKQNEGAKTKKVIEPPWR